MAAHQSVAGTKSSLRFELYAAPFHSFPPTGPGQVRRAAVLIGPSVFSSVVNGFVKTISCVSASTARRSPSLPDERSPFYADDRAYVRQIVVAHVMRYERLIPAQRTGPGIQRDQ